MSQQGNRTEPPSDATAACMCGDEGPNGERCDVCGFNFTSFRQPKPRGVRLNGGGLMLDEEYDPLLGWCYCGKTGPVDEKCKRCYYEFTNDPNLLMREYNSDLYFRAGPLGATANTDIWSKTGPIHRIGNSSEESLGDDVISTIKAPDWRGGPVPWFEEYLAKAIRVQSRLELVKYYSSFFRSSFWPVSSCLFICFLMGATRFEKSFANPCATYLPYH